MDLDLLSSRWQQQLPAPVSPTAADLRALLAGRPQTPVARMCRNVWVEIATTFIFGALIVGFLVLIQAPRLGILLALMLPFYASIGYCYFRIVRVLWGLRAATGALASHVAAQLRQLRQLMRLYYGATMLSAGAILGLLSYVAIRYMLPHMPPTGQMRFLTWVILTAAISVGVTHWFCRYHMQNFYGQHLDRLEGVLHELQENE